jgi:serine protease
MKKNLVVIALLLACFSTFAQQAATVFGELLVKPNKNATAIAIENEVQTLVGILPKFKLEKCVSAYMNIWLYSFDENEISKAELLRVLATTEGVDIAQANHIIESRLTPNDPFFGQQWYHVQSGDHDIDTDLAWDITTGGTTALGDEIVVCVIEPSGANWALADLVDNHWTNTNEIPDNNIDDDGNGYVDDVNGWNINNDSDAIGTGNHGTQVSSMIGARGDNNSGIAGVNWDVKIMQVQLGGISEANVIAAYEYPMTMRKLYNQTNGEMGAFVVATNSSWGTDNGQPEEAPLWCAMYDSLGTYGVLSCGSTANNNVNIDVVGDLPTACPSEFLLSVTATNNNDVRTFSGYGQTTIDLGAPGENVYLANNNGYSNTSGTSFASPCVAGAIALLYSAPCTSFMQIVNADAAEGAMMALNYIYDGVDAVANLSDECVTGGRLNINNSINLMLANCAEGSCVAPFAIDVAQQPGTLNYTISWAATTEATTFSVRYRPTGSAEWLETTGVTSNNFELNNLLACSSYEYQLATQCTDTTSQWTEVATFDTDGCCENPMEYWTADVTANSATLNWNDVLAAEAYTLVYGPVGGPFTTIENIVTNEYLLNGLLPCTQYTVSVFSTCVGDEPVPSDFDFNTIGCTDCQDITYCDVNADAALEYIENVTLGDINHNSEGDGGYILVEDETTTLVVNQSYTVYCTPGYTGFSYSEYFKVWIDYDSDGLFEDATELVFDAGQGSTNTVSGTFTVPAWVEEGVVRMRVSMSYSTPQGAGDPPVACGENEYGEIEDYCVAISLIESVEENRMAQLQLFPNPTNNYVWLSEQMFEHAGALSVTITDVSGALVRRQLVRKGEAISVADLANGIYTIKAEQTTFGGVLFVKE